MAADLAPGPAPLRTALASGPRRGALFIVSGPSGVGKGTIVRRLMERDPSLRLSVSVTTRQPRPGEQEGVSYHFRSHDQFAQLVEAGELLEHAQFGPNAYGTPRRWVEEQQAAGRDVILEIEVKGAIQIKERCAEGVYVFVLPPTLEELASRLRGRQSETPDAVRQRLAIAQDELDFLPMYDFRIVNDDLETAVGQLQAIIEAERCRVPRRSLA